MAKKVGYEVTGTKPVCVDFLDGRSVSFRPGQRFEAAVTNSSVLRLVRVHEVRKLSAVEVIPPLPPKLGAPRRVQNILKRRADVEAAKIAAQAKMAASKKAPPQAEPEEVDLGSLSKQKKTSKTKPRPVAFERPSVDE